MIMENNKLVINTFLLAFIFVSPLIEKLEDSKKEKAPTITKKPNSKVL